MPQIIHEQLRHPRYPDRYLENIAYHNTFALAIGQKKTNSITGQIESTVNIEFFTDDMVDDLIVLLSYYKQYRIDRDLWKKEKDED